MTAAAPQHKIVHRAYEPRHDHNLELDFPGFLIYPFVDFQVSPIYRQKIGQGFKPGERESEKKREGERHRQAEREREKDIDRQRERERNFPTEIVQKVWHRKPPPPGGRDNVIAVS